MVQLSHQYMTTGKTIALTIWTFVGKVMSLLLNILSRFATAFLAKITFFLDFINNYQKFIKDVLIQIYAQE